VLARPGRQFESHLGHANPLVRGGFLLSVCTKLWPVDSDGGSRPWPGRRGGLFRCVGGGLSALAGGLTACCLWVRVVPRFGSVGLVWGWPTPVHGFAVRERHDEASLVRNGLGRPLLVARGVVVVYVSGQGRCGQCPHLRLLLGVAVGVVSTVGFRDMNSYRRCQKRKKPSPAGHPSHHRLTSGWGVLQLDAQG
jgi:hypothetical protein